MNATSATSFRKHALACSDLAIVENKDWEAARFNPFCFVAMEGLDARFCKPDFFQLSALAPKGRAAALGGAYCLASQDLALGTIWPSVIAAGSRFFRASAS